MKAFIKVVALVILALIAIKLLPLTIGLGFAIGILLVALAVVGVSVAALVLGAVVMLAALLSPVWIPVLALVGLIALIKRTGHRREIA